MKDGLVREIKINASKERIYAAIANPDLLVLWFPDTVEGAYAVGEQPILGFGQDGNNKIFIVDAIPHKYFAFRWVPGCSSVVDDILSVATTLVEFRITPLSEGGCMLSLTESGFSNLPAEVAENSLKQNLEGWLFMLNRLEHYISEL